jgi:hypothetical protein
MSWASTTLTQVETTIQNIISGGANKSYSINGRSFSRENLSDLFKIRSELLKEVARGNAGSEFILAELGGQSAYQRFA